MLETCRSHFWKRNRVCLTVTSIALSFKACMMSRSKETSMSVRRSNASPHCTERILCKIPHARSCLFRRNLLPELYNPCVWGAGGIAENKRLTFQVPCVQPLGPTTKQEGDKAPSSTSRHKPVGSRPIRAPAAKNEAVVRQWTGAGDDRAEVLCVLLSYNTPASKTRTWRNATVLLRKKLHTWPAQVSVPTRQLDRLLLDAAPEAGAADQGDAW